MNTKDKIQQFAVIAQEIAKRRLLALCGSIVGNEQSFLSSIKPGRKYTKVDIGTSGRYMIENETERIYGIRAYGVIHRGRFYGMLDEFNAKYGNEVVV